MNQYPLLFTFQDKVSGEGFLAGITVHGRGLAVEESDGWWMYGVQPGDLSAGGATFMEAQREFRKAFTVILFDIAEDAKDFNSFKAEVGRFFKGINCPTEEEWHAAVLDVRAGKITAEALSKGLQKRPANSPRSVQVKLLRVFNPKDNVLEPQMAVAA
ncbi:hypothetical protein CLG94_09595 [Candidatus Methylomirabilis limnetica]|uniref:Uncharacterized protein n=1 Tax=Candidatus Methylomirabilis limnetica TaxID=2033718 RepID=A0A2T4TWM2_9BACT|nr:hypothetical protein [Candidatus Methylomirabilis limnetica]PTL35513.1 hypothetical protein CLG94_09595 [Candidatus Methylomirabilis limnetica]